MPAPTVSNPLSDNITSNSATLRAEISTDADEPIIARGFVIVPASTNSDPTVGGRTVRDIVAASGVFAVNVTDLSPDTEYAYAAYATNRSGTEFSRPVTRFRTSAQSQAEFFAGLKERAVASGDWFTRTFQAVFTIPFIAFIVLCSLIVVVGVFVYKNNDKTPPMEFARGLITVLFATGTMAIAFVLTVTAIMATDVKFEDRFSRGKEVLTILIGIFGTILGFYFGTATESAPAAASRTVASTTSDATVTGNSMTNVAPSLSASPDSIMIKRGGSVTTVKVTYNPSSDMLTGKIRLRVDSPEGITATVTPSTIDAAKTVTVNLDVMATKDAVAGVLVMVRVTATSESGATVGTLELNATILD